MPPAARRLRTGGASAAYSRPAPTGSRSSSST